MKGLGEFMRINSTNLKIVRIKKGIKQKDLALMIGISQNLLSMYESGKRNPKLDTIKKIVVILDCAVEDIIS